MYIVKLDESYFKGGLLSFNESELLFNQELKYNQLKRGKKCTNKINLIYPFVVYQ